MADRSFDSRLEQLTATSSSESVEIVNPALVEEALVLLKSHEEVYREHGLWEGWSKLQTVIPLGPGKELILPEAEDSKFETVGFAVPLPPVSFELRSTKKYPPPTEKEMFREMFKLVQVMLKTAEHSRRAVLENIYNHVKRNNRDSPAWQAAFIKVRGVQVLLDVFRNPGPREANDPLGDQYWVIAIFGRMIGTVAESRKYLIAHGAKEVITQGTQDSSNPEVRDCALCALKALVQFKEGRKIIPYNELLHIMTTKM
mmetsp:Transcript_59648/g.134385  ORF Transcript_59648/g.134385 Transcript_59648/m.134385 type:complete len:257 (-) Transcript_59648:447-1217(-)|eukprot:CAMPEP_0197911896 /NCGR_PEP_ID=MMETSP1439-20131203/73739_1 /TAXON_ID=66791 /ORGANISM="Gonyaulax spinifera, Strain CCMP409" /LENGTH=256 /DNA_ID=CAMNT_0043533659 /DNA_START=79 /DNA_END=849 /DNA_ORIENTATION=-